MTSEDRAETDASGGELHLPEITDDFMRAGLAQARTYTTVLLKRTPKLVRPDVDPVIWEHGRRNFALRESGVMPVVLPVGDDSEWAGFAVFDRTLEETCRIMDGDPGVRAGIFTYEAHPVRGFPGSSLPG
jgi:hypothetical protein